MRGFGLDIIHLEYGIVAGCCERGNEHMVRCTTAGSPRRPGAMPCRDRRGLVDTDRSCVVFRSRSELSVVPADISLAPHSISGLLPSTRLTEQDVTPFIGLPLEKTFRHSLLSAGSPWSARSAVGAFP
jgi:hypothetical protein